MIAAGIVPVGVDVQPPDFALLAASYGYAHRLIENPESLRAALLEFARRRQVVMLEIAAD
jgi:thiamine pyrophosphate-dependent acetolactate synthase large subunit-like protein